MTGGALITRNRDFGLYYVGQATSAIGNGVVPVVFAFAALQVAPGGGLIPIVLLALWGSRVSLLPFGSVVAERRNKAAVMLVADIGRLVAQLVAAVPFVLHASAAWQLVVSAAVYGACTAFFMPASFAVLPKIVEREYLQRANALLGIARNVGLVAGPALGGLLVTTGGVAFALLFDVATFAVSVATLAVLKARSGNGTTPLLDADPDIVVRFWDGVRVIPRVRGIVPVLSLFCVVQFGTAAVGVLGPIIANQSLGGIGAWSAIVTSMATGALVGSAVATRLEVRKPVRWTLIAFGVLMPIELFAIAVPLGVWTIVTVVLFTTVVTEVAGVTFDAYVQRAVPEEFLARVGAVESGLLDVMNPIGVAVTFPLAAAFGIQGFLMGVGAVILVTALGAGISMSQVTSHRSREPLAPADGPFGDAAKPTE